MKFGSICSGIEAASVAWGPLGWKAAWFSEIEPFPCAVLAHHYPEVPNLGSMTEIPALLALGEIDAPDVLCGGTPCQAFSVAGLRRSLDDARGNLSLVFCEIADAIDQRRDAAGQQPCIVFWENVPGVLNTKDNAFGCFLAGLAGEDDALVPPGGKWTDAGAVFGPARAVAWRVLDAQYFGLAQRRKRVFVVASARDDFDPVAVLLEFDGVRRDSAPSREAGEATAGGAAAGAGVGDAGGPGLDFQNVATTGEVCGTLMGEAQKKAGQAGHGVLTTGAITHSLRGEGFDASEDGTGRGTPLVPVSFKENMSTPAWGVGVSQTLQALNFEAVAFSAQACQLPGPDRDTSVSESLTCSQQAAVAFSSKDFGADATTDLSPTLRAMGHAGSHANGGGQMAVAFPIISDADRSDSSARTPSPDAEGRVRLRDPGLGVGNDGDPMFTLQATKPHAVGTAMQVRRLTPRECERLQGFPDDYTLVPNRGKPAADGPRYKALGNSWAVPVVRWIGARIDLLANIV
jgi:DNA (cytosine-5)-methyltransferase 1